MTKIPCARFIRFLASLALALSLAQLAHAASLEEVALLKSADRQRILVEGAKKEGKLSFYTTLIV
jgi:iron(III) transport system substrate-binding protein